ncbi:MAG: DUF255 domain-containing protein [Myxococcota bacterium]|nr:DUF255 domain-containing protein [Myxococcota bacterium]
MNRTPGRFRLAVSLATAMTLFWGTSAGLASSKPQADARRNHLAGEASPYLQLHVYNPVDWYPWGPEAFEKAKREDKLIFLSVGYSTCYWCHVMEREVFSDPEIAKLMNASFVSVKVDREERPDIDEIYMQATQLLTRSGGWPNSVFLTPDGKPFFAGTYFPPQASGGRPGFPSVLNDLSSRWKTERNQVIARAERVAEAIRSGFSQTDPVSASFDPMQLLARGVDGLARRFDEEHGGFGSRTKFPSPPQLELLLTAHERKLPGPALEMLRKTLDEMATGGIYDHLAGGFHRYSTEPTWSVPHFEKMLYDNAQLLGLYARAHKATGDPLYRRVAEGIADYLAAEMTSPMGGLYSAQDAEVDSEEGASYVWTAAQIQEVLGEKAAGSLLSVYQLAPIHRDGTGPGALRVRLPLATALARTGDTDAVTLLGRFSDSRTQLLAARNRREQPLRDEKVLAAWNGLAIRGLVDAGVELGHPEYVERAGRAADFVLARLLDDGGRLHRSYIAGRMREEAVLDDYAFLADGLVALHAATGEKRWLTSARRLADAILADFEGPPGMGFYLSSQRADRSNLFVRPRVLSDNVTPSGNTVALRVLRDLAMLTSEARYGDAAERTQTALGSLFERAPSAVGTAVRTLASGPQLPAPPFAKPGTADKPTALPATRIPTGRDFVSGSLTRSAGSASQVLLHVKIVQGWHVNANPASLEFLIPTRVEPTRPDTQIQVDYPEGSRYHPRFSPEPLSVYEGEIEISVHSGAPLPTGEELALTFQACDDRNCLPPETVEFAVP